LRDYAYTSAGAYFVTICTQERGCLFGAAQTAALMPPGEMIGAWWLALPGKFPGVTGDIFVIMPNHVHGIIWLAPDPAVGADPRVRLGGLADTLGAADIWIERPKQGGHGGPPLPEMVLPHPEQLSQ
jgi:hypothetical protein